MAASSRCGRIQVLSLEKGVKTMGRDGRGSFGLQFRNDSSAASILVVADFGAELVQLDDQVGLPLVFHQLLEITGDESVGAAAEIGDIDGKQAGVPIDKLGGPEDALAEVPVHPVKVAGRRNSE